MEEDKKMAKHQRGKLASFAATKGVETPAARPLPVAHATKAGGWRGMTLRLDPTTWRRLKLATIDQGRPAHDIVTEALVAALDRHEGERI